MCHTIGIYFQLLPEKSNNKNKRGHLTALCTILNLGERKMSNKVEGIFQITGWDEIPYSELDDGSKQSSVKVTQSYSGSIEGNSEIRYLMSYQSESSAIFVGFETIKGTFLGKNGSVIVQHNGIFESGVASSKFTIVANSGKGDCLNISGAGSFKSGENGQANYEMEINI